MGTTHAFQTSCTLSGEKYAQLRLSIHSFLLTVQFISKLQSEAFVAMQRWSGGALVFFQFSGFIREFPAAVTMFCT